MTVPVAILSEVPDATLEMYRAVNAQPELASPAPGHLFHGVSGLQGGGLRVFDVWESEEHFRRYDREVIQPAVHAVTGGAVGPPRRQVVPVAVLRSAPELPASLAHSNA